MQDLADYELGTTLEWTSLALLRVYTNGPLGKEFERALEEGRQRQMLGYVLVIDRRKFGDGAKYKLPGGHKKLGETPLQTAMREVEGETGISLPSHAFTYHDKYLGWRKDHWKCIFSANLSEKDRDWMNTNNVENEGEKPEFLTTEEFYRAVREGRVLREHYEKLVEYALLAPLGRDKKLAAAS